MRVNASLALPRIFSGHVAACHFELVSEMDTFGPERSGRQPRMKLKSLNMTRSSCILRDC